jgi:hypothetical protein
MSLNRRVISDGGGEISSTNLFVIQNDTKQPVETRGYLFDVEKTRY